jgi:hypothetical protein
MKKIFTLLSFLFIVYTANSQVLISLLLGDKLNSGKIEFGLDGGWNISTIYGAPGAKVTHGFNLGFYFDFRLKNPKWMVHTGVLVKSPMGADGLPVYALNDSILDTAFIGGTVSRKLRYFNVPIMIKYKFTEHFFAEAGFMLGLGYKAVDQFQNTVVNENDLSYDNKIIKTIHKIDAGAMAGVGYRIISGNGINLGLRYYFGFVQISNDLSQPNMYNRGLYVYGEIPIGAGKAKKKAAEKAAKEKESAGQPAK